MQSEKMRALGQFVAGIAHELNNPIGFVAGNLDHLRAGGRRAGSRCSPPTRGAPPAGARDAELAARRPRCASTSCSTICPGVLRRLRGRRATGGRDRRRAARLRPRRSPRRRGGGSTCASASSARSPCCATASAPRSPWCATTATSRPSNAPPGSSTRYCSTCWQTPSMRVGGRGTICVGMRLAHDPPGGAAGGPHAVVSVRDDGAGMPPDVCAADLRPLLHHQAGGAGHRARAQRLVWDRRAARRHDRRRLGARARHDLHHLPRPSTSRRRRPIACAPPRRGRTPELSA